jgi:guanylate kinase
MSTVSSSKRRGVMLVVSSPSGAGKTTLTRALIGADAGITLSVSVTTRARRPSEVDGVHYHFVSPKHFEAMRAGGELLEWAEVHGNCYGTPREPVENALKAGRDVLFDIDWQGTRQLCENMREDVVSVFILPPSAVELRTRLVRRAEDSDDVIAHRLGNAVTEISRWNEYDYVLINDDLDRAFADLASILGAERVRCTRRPGLETFVSGLLEELEGMKPV